MDDLHVDPRLQPIPKGALVDKIALVTGASRGIGAVTARVLAQAGAQVILNYRSKGARAEKVAAQLDLLKKGLPLLQREGRAIFVTSHLAHFYGQKPVYPGYEPVAIGKLAGERALRAMIPQLATRKVTLIVVSGDMIEGTITPKLLNRTNRGLIEFRREQAGRLPTVEEFGQAIAEAAADPNLQSGATVYVGATE